MKTLGAPGSPGLATSDQSCEEKAPGKGWPGLCPCRPFVMPGVHVGPLSPPETFPLIRHHLSPL